MNKFGILGIGVLALSTACSSGDFGGDSPSYNAKILNWPATKTGFVRITASNSNGAASSAYVTINTDGSFSNLLFPGNASMTPILDLPTFPTCAAGSVTITPDTVKIGSAGIQVLNKATLAAGSILELNREPGDTPKVGDEQVFRIFSDGNLKINGVCNSNRGSVFYDVNLSTGWNVAIIITTEVTGTRMTRSKFTSGALPSDSKLYYTASGSNTLSFDNLFR